MQTLLIEMKTILLFYFIGNRMNKSIDKTKKSITRNALLRRKRKNFFFAISLRKLKKISITYEIMKVNDSAMDSSFPSENITPDSINL